MLKLIDLHEKWIGEYSLTYSMSWGTWDIVIERVICVNLNRLWYSGIYPDISLGATVRIFCRCD